MTYLLDVNVIQENHPGGHENVRAWFATVADADLYLSVMTLREIEQGIEKARKKVTPIGVVAVHENPPGVYVMPNQFYNWGTRYRRYAGG